MTSPYNHFSDSSLIVVGYAALIERYNLIVLPHYRRSFISMNTVYRTVVNDGFETHMYPKTYLPEDTFAGHLEFALKYDGLNLEILAALFAVIDPQELEVYVLSAVTGKYTRQVWFLYEWLTEKQLHIPDITMGNYVNLLAPAGYYTVDAPIRSKRHRINNNLLGTKDFCPIVRRTVTLQAFEKKQLALLAQNTVKHFNEAVIERAIHYLYIKETKSSFAIEHEQPNEKRQARFIALLKTIGFEVLTKEKLVELQNAIVDERFADTDYRHSQNYVGETLSNYRQKLHYISPCPADVEHLMAGLLAITKLIKHPTMDAVVVATLLAFGFVFIHPFEDGNGRLHRFLIHYVLMQMGFTSEGMIFPVSSVMLQESQKYNACLEKFSKPLLSLIQHTLEDDGHLIVHNHTQNFYRFMDMTTMVEYLYTVIEQTITHDFVDELNFIVNYDAVRIQMKTIVDLPNRLADLFIKLCLENKGQVSKTKRARYFAKLTEVEIAELEKIVIDQMSQRHENN